MSLMKMPGPADQRPAPPRAQPSSAPSTNIKIGDDGLDDIVDEDDDDDEDGDGGASTSGKKKSSGRRRIVIEYIRNKSRRHITFSKRKAGIMKKAFELSVLTGIQMLLLIASETGHVYTYATTKLQPMITTEETKNMIQRCLNAVDEQPVPVRAKKEDKAAVTSTDRVGLSVNPMHAAAVQQAQVTPQMQAAVQQAQANQTLQAQHQHQLMRQHQAQNTQQQQLMYNNALMHTVPPQQYLLQQQQDQHLQIQQYLMQQQQQQQQQHHQQQQQQHQQGLPANSAMMAGMQQAHHGMVPAGVVGHPQVANTPHNAPQPKGAASSK